MIRVGIGGWTYAPWRGVFYPKGLRQLAELNFASRQVTAIEINGTFYRTPSVANFRHWAAETPDNFVFAVKGPRYVSQRRVLAEAGPSVQRFFDSGVLELGAKLGPVLWRLPPTKKFVAEDLAAFLALLPRVIDGRRIRHVLEVRHESFLSAAFVDLMRGAQVPIVFADTDQYPSISDVTGEFVYARLMRSVASEPTGYGPEAIETCAAWAKTWARGGEPVDLPRVTAADDGQAHMRDCFIFFISGAKVRAPAAAVALVKRLNGSPPRG